MYTGPGFTCTYNPWKVTYFLICAVGALNKIMFNTVLGFQNSVVLSRMINKKMLWRGKVGDQCKLGGQTKSLEVDKSWSLNSTQVVHR